MYTERSRSMRDIGPVMAQELLKCNTFPGQRRLRPWWVEAMVKMHNAGELRRCDIGMAHMNGDKILVNGQHTLTAIVQSKDAFPCVVVDYDCHDDQDLWKLYGSFDTHLKRSQGDILHAAQGSFKYPELRDLPGHLLSTCMGALVMLRGQDSEPLFATPVGMTPAEKVGLLETHLDAVIFISEVWRVGKPNLMTVPAAAAAINMYRRDEKAASAFWKRTLDGVGLLGTDPEYRLRETLLSYSMSKTGAGGWPRFRMIYVACAQWWNSSRTGISRKRARSRNINEVPEII